MRKKQLLTSNKSEQVSFSIVFIFLYLFFVFLHNIASFVRQVSVICRPKYLVSIVFATQS